MSHFSFLLGLIEHFLQIMSRHSFPAGLIEDSFIVMSPQQHYMGHTVIFSLYVPTDLIYGTFLIFAPHMSHFPILSGHFLHFFLHMSPLSDIANCKYVLFKIPHPIPRPIPYLHKDISHSPDPNHHRSAAPMIFLSSFYFRQARLPLLL